MRERLSRGRRHHAAGQKNIEPDNDLSTDTGARAVAGGRQHSSERQEEGSMDYRKKFFVDPDEKPRLQKLDPGYKGDHESEETAKQETEDYRAKLAHQQALLYAQRKHSVLIVLQAPDAGGKDGTVNHIFSALNPQGTTVVGFKQPTPLELAHDFLRRVHLRTPGRGEVAIFNRSHYEDVLVTRVHKLIDKATWTARYKRIREFETGLADNGTMILKFFLHISREEQLARFADRLEDPKRNWNQRIRLYRAGAVGRLYRSIRGCDQRHQHPRGAMVCHPVQPQVVSQSGGVADCGGLDGSARHEVPKPVCRSGGDPAPVPRGRGGEAEPLKGSRIPTTQPGMASPKVRFSPRSKPPLRLLQ
jgi:PPK2 family polyphosphate:nucleotide phosphotransferase